MTAEVKLCAARMYGPGSARHDCTNLRNKDSLFCWRHQHASNRFYLVKVESYDELLDDMAYRDLRRLTDG